MRQQQFERANEPLWAEYRLLLQRLEQGPRGRGRGRWQATGRLPPEVPVERLPKLVRTVSAQYALARSRGYSPGLVGELHQLVRRGYRQLHRVRPQWPALVRRFVLGGFPRALRREAAAFWLACALLFGPMLAMGLACLQDPALIHTLVDAGQVAELESMYDPANERLGRQADDAVAVFGFYLRNNIGVAFRTFASGLLLGIGSLFLLVFNGLFIGAAAGHLTGLGMGEAFWSFVSGHSALELTAIAIAGAAGLLLARGLLAPGRQTRAAALRREALGAVPLISGAVLMLLVAAVIEAFWSAGTAVDPSVKLAVGALGWLLVGAYLLLAGRGDDEPAHADGP